MKKLTAGILASLIGLVSANSADAAVASKAYVDGAVESLDVAATEGASARHFINSVSETDGKISAQYKDLQEAIVGGGSVEVRVVESGDNAGKLEVYGTEHYDEGLGINISDDNKISTDIVSGSENVSVTPSADGTQVVISVSEQDIASYDFGDTTTVNLEKEEVDGGFKITATGLYTGGNGVNVDGNVITTDATGTGSVTVDYNEQGQMVINGTDTTYEGIHDVNITDVNQDGVFEVGTDYYEAKNTDGKTATEGWYSLTRKCSNVAADGSLTDTSVCEYQWELIDRSYAEGDSDVPHDNEAGNTPATGA